MTRVRATKAWVVNGVLIVLLIAAGFAIYEAFSPAASTAQAQTRTTQVRRATVTQTVSASGTLASTYTGSANFATAGKVTAIDVKVGQKVTAGQKLATIDSTQAAKQLQVAKSNLEVAEEDLSDASTSSTSSTSVGGQGSQQTSTSSTASLQAKVEQAQLDVENAQTTMESTTLYAPGAGTVTAVNGSVGQQSSGGSSSSASSSSSSSSSGQGTGATSSAASSSGGSGFITITDMTHLVVTTSVAEIDVSKIKAGQSATVTLNALPDKPVQAKVSSVDLTPTTSGNVVSYGAKLTLTDPPSGLRPGQTASVVITVAEAQNALSVPAAAVQTTGNSSFVTVRQNGQNVTRQVQVGIRGESTVQVTSGLSEGDDVVLTATAATGTSGNQRGGGTGFPGGGAGTGGGGFGGFGGGR